MAPTSPPQEASPPVSPTVGDSIETYTLNLGLGVTDFYYRVEMVPATGDADGNLGSFQNQWGRTAVGGSPAGFTAVFSTVPEPSRALLTFLGLGAVLAGRRRS